MSNIIDPFKNQNKEVIGPDMAFPLFATFPGQVAGQVNVMIQGGMTLRDYFAAAAMNGFFSNNADLIQAIAVEQKNIAILCYKVADKMIEARKEVSNG